MWWAPFASSLCGFDARPSRPEHRWDGSASTTLARKDGHKLHLRWSCAQPGGRAQLEHLHMECPDGKLLFSEREILAQCELMKAPFFKSTLAQRVKRRRRCPAAARDKDSLAAAGE
jgi:hypothetical protein